MLIIPPSANPVVLDNTKLVSESDIGFVNDEVNTYRSISFWGGQNFLHQFSDINLFFTSDVHKHSPLIFPERRATGYSKDLRQFAADVVEVKILDHPAAACGIRINIERDPLLYMFAVNARAPFILIEPTPLSRGH